MPEDQIEIRCPGCGARYWIDEDQLGSEAECGVCKRDFVVATDTAAAVSCVHRKKSMRNITLSMDEDLLTAGRAYAREHNTSLNKLVRELLRRTVTSSGSAWVDECFRRIDGAGGRSGGKTWSREDLYDV